MIFYLTLLQVARVVRKNDRPFGGIQLVLCGDFLQLPPVQKDKEVKFCFQVTFRRYYCGICIDLMNIFNFFQNLEKLHVFFIF